MVRRGAAVAVAAMLAGCAVQTPGTMPVASTVVPPSPGVSTAVSPSSTTAPSASATVSAGPATVSASPPVAIKELPRGGTTVFPTYRLFGYSGFPGAPGQGRLGIGKLDDRMAEIEKRGQAFRKGRKLLPVMELIAVTVHATPGADGMYRTRVGDAIIAKWLAAARRHKALLLLNIQPGRADFIDEVRYFQKWLREPDVGLALDPEWAVGKHQIPGRVFGSTTGKELDGVASWVSALVAAHGLPEKVIVFHQLHASIVARQKDLKAHPGVVMIKSVDGIGGPAAKAGTFRLVVKNTPSFVHTGFKLFYVEDVKTGGRLMTPKEVLALKPTPEYVLFE